VIIGSVVSGWIVFTPAPGMLKLMMSNPGAALASRIACLKDPAPASFVFVTVKMETACRADKDHFRNGSHG